jgi:hypothetical protein
MRPHGSSGRDRMTEGMNGKRYIFVRQQLLSAAPLWFGFLGDGQVSRQVVGWHLVVLHCCRVYFTYLFSRYDSSMSYCVSLIILFSLFL